MSRRALHITSGVCVLFTSLVFVHLIHHAFIVHGHEFSPGSLIAYLIIGAASSSMAYPLGTTDRERQRLVRQAELLHDITLDTFRAAGLGPGMRVLDIGSGAGDVAMLAANLVGTGGSVLGIDRDANNVAFAQSRAADAGRSNVTFRQAEIDSFTGKNLFDAVVGRYILLYVPDRAAVLRQLAATLTRGGILAFIEPDFSTPVRSFPEAPLFQQAGGW